MFTLGLGLIVAGGVVSVVGLRWRRHEVPVSVGAAGLALVGLAVAYLAIRG